jgi:hypothetical protein
MGRNDANYHNCCYHLKYLEYNHYTILSLNLRNIFFHVIQLQFKEFPFSLSSFLRHRFKFLCHPQCIVLSICSSIRLRDPISYPYKIMGVVENLYILA